MERFFRNLFSGGAERAEFIPSATQRHQFMQDAMNPQQQAYRGPPPASSNAIRQLPTIQVTPEDLVDPSNRECCICLEENHLHDRVTRLPCAHIFHHACILDWLEKHCTCPVCRYELATDDANFERKRQKRMRDRKPRFATYELERMSVKELRALAVRVRISTAQIVDKSDLIQQLVESGRLDIIAAPEPVEYPLSLLKSMGVGELKRCMADAGVFFDQVDVVEKQDMVRIFINSGRLVILPEEVNVKHAAEVSNAAQTRTVNLAQSRTSPHAMDLDDEWDGKKRKRRPIVTTVDGDSDNEGHVEEGSASHASTGACFIEPIDDVDFHAPERTLDHSQEWDQHSTSESLQEAENQPEADAAEVSNMNGTLGCESQGLDDDENDVEMDQIPWIVGRHGSASAESESEMTEGYSSLSVHSTRFRERSIAELRALAREVHVDLSGCIERPEMITRLVNASGMSTQSQPSATSSNEYIPEPHHFNGWSVSELRALANEVDADLSDCRDRDDMVQTLVDAAIARPHMANYLGALAPLARLTVPQLRAVAREWHVNVWDCLEKDEIIHRLVTAGGPSGEC